MFSSFYPGGFPDMPVLLRSHIAPQVADFPHSTNPTRAIGNDGFPIDMEIENNVSWTNIKRCLCTLIRTGDAGANIQDILDGYSRTFVTNYNLTTIDYVPFDVVTNGSPLVMYDSFLMRGVQPEITNYVYSADFSILADRTSVIYEQDLINPIHGIYGFSCNFFLAPISFRASKSYMITDGLKGANGFVNSEFFDVLLAQRQEKVQYDSGTATAPPLAWTGGPAEAGITTSIDFIASQTPSSKHVEMKLLNYVDYATCRDTPLELWDADFFDGLMSPTLAEAMALGGCQYWGVIRHVAPFFTSQSITVTATASCTLPEWVIGSSRAELIRESKIESDLANQDLSWSYFTPDGKWSIGVNHKRKYGNQFASYYSASHPLTDSGAPMPNQSICLLP